VTGHRQPVIRRGKITPLWSGTAFNHLHEIQRYFNYRLSSVRAVLVESDVNINARLKPPSPRALAGLGSSARGFPFLLRSLPPPSLRPCLATARSPRPTGGSIFAPACYFSDARATSWRSAARRLQAPPGGLFDLCRIEVLARLALRRTRSPTIDEVRVVAFRLLGKLLLLIPQRLDVIGVSWTPPIALLLWPAGLEHHGAGFVGDQGWPRPQVVLIFGQHVPAKHRQLARHRDSGDLMAPSGSDADEEGVQRPRRLGHGPGRLDQHRPSVAASSLPNAPVMSGAESGLTHPRVQSEIAHQLPWAAEPADVADCRHDARRHRQIDAGDRQQPFDGAVVERALGDLAVENGKVVGEPIEFAQMSHDRLPFVLGQRLALEPLRPGRLNRSE
jgi:hypothetical protein